MKIKLACVLLSVLGLGVNEASGATSGVGYVNISGTAVAGGQTITINLNNAAGAVVASTTYTTVAGDTDQKISDKLDTNFGSPTGFGAKKVTDKANSTEVIKFWRKKNNGQDFEITFTVVPGPSEITIIVKGSYSNQRVMSVAPTGADFGTGTAAVSLIGQGTAWMSGPFAVTSLYFADDINVNSFQVLSDTLINANISWSPGSALLGGQYVDVRGNDVDDSGAPLTDIVHDVSMDPFVLGNTIPSVSEWGLIIMMLLLVTAGVLVIRRRQRISMVA